jgi:hypothetical protein
MKARAGPAAARSRGDGEPAPDDPGADRPPFFAQTLNVESKSLLGVLGGFVDVLALLRGRFSCIDPLFADLRRRPNQWTLGEEDQIVERALRLCGEPWQTLRERQLEVGWACLCGQLQPKFALSLVEKPADIDQGQANKIAVLVEADSVPFGPRRHGSHQREAGFFGRDLPAHI